MGRPREFDSEVALDRALEVFWSKGFAGASLDDLTGAMGINRPSLYAAFGDKAALFRRAIARYAAGPAAFANTAFQEVSSRKVAERLLHGAVEFLTDPRHPRGCLLVQGALACSEEAECIRKELNAQRKKSEAALRRRFQTAATENDLPAGTNPASLARYLFTVVQGMSVQSAGGASRTELTQVADLALRLWPDRGR